MCLGLCHKKECDKTQTTEHSHILRANALHHLYLKGKSNHNRARCCQIKDDKQYYQLAVGQIQFVKCNQCQLMLPRAMCSSNIA